MALRTDYWPGGFLPAAPAKNRKIEVDSVANTVTLWDRQGNQTSQRALTPAEQAEAAAADAATGAEANQETILAKIASALTVNATFLGLTSPTNAQTLAQVKMLTREVNGLLRLAGGLLTDISDT